MKEQYCKNCGFYRPDYLQKCSLYVKQRQMEVCERIFCVLTEDDIDLIVHALEFMVTISAEYEVPERQKQVMELLNKLK